ncbi:MAG TPA: hypothetical protein VKA97_05815, partial [Pyrinomonadaceae bacterium]|nr:hypothetical protein [Pyrinomonadaceae bacterium]
GEGEIKDARDVKVGATNASLFAYIADGEHHAIHVVQLISPETPGHYGFSPRPTPELIASKETLGPALSISEGVDRDRAVDESGNQLSVFGRRGARPFNGTEMQRMFMIGGKLFTVPEIKDGNTKENKDIRRFFGAPKTPDNAVQGEPAAPRNDGTKKTDEPKKTDGVKTGQAKEPEGPVGQIRPHKTDLSNLVFMSLPLAALFFQWRKRSRR